MYTGEVVTKISTVYNILSGYSVSLSMVMFEFDTIEIASK